MGTLARDIRYAVRTLSRTPGFTLLVVATLGIGIGANTAVFSVVDAVLLEGLPYPDPDRLVAVSRDAPTRGGGSHAALDASTLRELREEPGLFESTAAWRPWEPTLTGVDEPEVLHGAEVSYGMFSRVLRVRPELGRDLLAGDDVEGAPGVVLLSHRAWHERFQADPDVVGRSVSLSEMPYTVIGVMPEGFRPPFAPDASLWRALGPWAARGCTGHCADRRVLARLAPGVSLEQARAHATTLSVRTAERLPAADGGVGLAVVSLKEETTRASARPLWVLLGAVGFALLVACANVANLMLGRGPGRAREVAVRLALGAERGRIVAQLLTESLVLAAAGGVVGVAVAAWGTDALLALAPEGTVPPLEGVGMNLEVLGFTALLAAGTGVGFGLVPAWMVARRGVPLGLRATERRAGGRPGGSVAAAVQVALSLVLLVGAGLFVRSFQKLDAEDLGVRPEGVLSFDVVLPPTRYSDDIERRGFYDALLRRITDLPGVRSVGAAGSLPLGGDDQEADLLVEGTSAAGDASPTVQIRPVTEGYFGTVGLGVLAGRTFARSDDASAQRVTVVNETLARRYFPEGDAVGRRIAVDEAGTPAWRTIVGVVRDVRHHGIRDPARPAVYLPFAQASPGVMSVVVRVEGDPMGIAPEVRAAVSGLDPSLAAARVRPLRDLVDQALAPDRFVATLLTSFALLVLLLSGVGVYGAVSQAVTRRTREMGVRLAVGAESRDLVRVVMRSGLAVAGLGLALGAVGCVAVGGILSRLLYRVGPTDPLTVTVSVTVLAGVAAAAAWVPARRAGRSDPLTVLRQD